MRDFLRLELRPWRSALAPGRLSGVMVRFNETKAYLSILLRYSLTFLSYFFTHSSQTSGHPCRFFYMTTLTSMATKLPDAFQGFMAEMDSSELGPSIIASAVVGLLMLLGLITFKSVSSRDVLPGVPEYKGFPYLGAIPTYLLEGMPALIRKLIATGDEGVSYANIGGNVLVSCHDPALIREVHALPDEVASREGEPGRNTWSPFWTLRRLIGESLTNQVGPQVTHSRNVFIREFNNTKVNEAKFGTFQEIAKAHANSLTGASESADVEDIRYCAENFALAVWGDTLYGNPDHYKSGKVLALSKHIMELASEPWPSALYSIALFLRLVKPGEPMRSEAKLREGLSKVVEGNMAKLEEYEAANPDAPMKVIRSLSVATGGGGAGPLSTFALNFTTFNLFGGHHNIGLNVAWIMIELDKHPGCLAKLMNEINSVDTENFTQLNSKMPYLDACFTEINRLHPTVHATLRVINKETTLTSGKRPVKLAPGMLIYLSYLHLHTTKKFWGDDADVFVPERHIDGRSKDRPLMSFGYGPRSCVSCALLLLSS